MTWKMLYRGIPTQELNTPTQEYTAHERKVTSELYRTYQI